ncbi:MAG: helix-turn-helix domain-containing protein [Actinomycetes bacterium]
MLELLEERHMSQAELADRCGRPKKLVNEIVRGKASITPETALQLENVLGTPAAFWIQRERSFREALARRKEREEFSRHVGWLSGFPVRSMTNAGWLARRDDRLDQLLELLRFFGVASPDRWESQTLLSASLLRASPAVEMSAAALEAWLRMGMIQAQKMDCAPFGAKALRQALTEIRLLTVRPPEAFCEPLKQRCAECGVAVALVAGIPETHVSGATRWLGPGKAMIQLSFRHGTDDHFWFAFYHEAGHLLLHGKRDFFVEGLDASLAGAVRPGDSRREDEADDFAADLLAPRSVVRRFRQLKGHVSREQVIEAAAELGIAPGILVGRLQHDGLVPHSRLNGLKRRIALSRQAC